jgi:hypothetical protein
MTDLTVVVRKHEGTGFYGAEITCQGIVLGATAITSIEVNKFGENLTCYKLMRKIGEIDHTMVGLYNIKLDIRCEHPEDLIKVIE